MDTSIPNHFHFVFGLKEQTRPFHLMHYLCLASCIEINRPDAVYFHYHHEPHGPYWDRIRERLTLSRVEPVPSVANFAYSNPRVAKYAYAHHADFIRVEKLLETGGVYADMDTLFVNRLPAELFDKPFVIGEEDPVPSPATGEPQPSVCNALMMSQPEAEFARRYRDEMEGALDGTWSNHSCGLARRLCDRYPDIVHVEPQRSFFRYSWTKEGVAGLFEHCDRDMDDVYSLHLWEHLWWSRWRRDFSTFHAGKLTERHIRTVDSTYTLVARRFLPS